jgi:hypothetical protein
MNAVTVYWKCDGEQARLVNVLKRGERIMLYKVQTINGKVSAWISHEEFKAQFSYRPVTEKRNRVPRYQVTA